MTNNLKPEKISDTLFIYQDDKNVFSYGTDAVLLCAYAKTFIKNASFKKGIDLCSGTGIIGLMLLDKTENFICHAAEINKDACGISKMSAEISGLSDRYFIHNTDIRNFKDCFCAESFDYVFSNPPYMTDSCGFMCEKDYKNIARHEILCNIDDVFSAASFLLKTNSDIFTVYRHNRLSSLFAAAKKNSFEIKNMTFVYSKITKPPVLVLCRAKKQASEGLIVSPPLIIHSHDGTYTDDMKYITEKGEFPKSWQMKR